MTDIGLMHPCFSKVGAVRLIQVNADRLRPLLAKFDAQKTLADLKRAATEVQGSWSGALDARMSECGVRSSRLLPPLPEPT